MTKPELGNKHQCQHCGAKYFDLNRVPITCPKCGTVFHGAPLSRVARPAAADEDDADPMAGSDLVSLEEADSADKIVEVVDDEVEIEAADDDTFLEEEEGDDDDVVDLIDGDPEDDEER